MTDVLTSLAWRWSRVGGSQVVHLVPPHVLRDSRTACNRLPLADALLETPAGLLGEVSRCQACLAAGGAG
jgi:hypothetical protein